jgi:two-component sensor histidine kinase
MLSSTHSTDAASTLTVRCLHEGDSKYRVVVADDGIGLAEGTTWPVPGKLGTLIVQTLRENTKEMNLTVETAAQKGTRVTKEFEHKLYCQNRSDAARRSRRPSFPGGTDGVPY